jgi:hypothetical protein
MSLRQYLILCEEWEYHPTTELFSRVVAGADVLSRSHRDLATLFEVSESTISRWSKGYARPHRRVQRYVVSTLKRLAVRAVRAAEPQLVELVPAAA